MADESDAIRIDLKSDTSEADKARKKLADVEQQVKELKSSFEQGNVATARYNQELKNLERQADRARAALDKIKPAGKLTGTARAGAISRAGLLGANTLQDVIQGGPASGINNILGAANDRGIKALAGEALAAAGGIRVVAAGLGTLAVVAGATFATIDEGLKDNKLGWGDLGSVIDTMSGGAFSTFGQAAGNALTTAHDAIASTVGAIADATIGWNASAEAVRKNNEEIERGVAAVREYAAAQKSLAGVKSTAQKKQEADGKAFVNELADAGGKGGLDSILDRLAEAETEKTGNVKVTVPKLNEKGEATGEQETITRREQARRRLTMEVARAQDGDEGAQGRIRRQLGSIGVAGSRIGHVQEKKDQNERVREAEEGIADDQKESEARDKKDKKDKEDRQQQANDDADEELARAADTHGRKAMRGTGLDGRADDALLRSALANGGKPGAAVDEVANRISQELQGKGVDADVADRLGREKAQERAESLGDKVNDKAMEGPEKLRSVQHFGAAEFTRSVEGSGEDKVATNTEKMISQLADLVRLTQQGPVLAQ